MEDFRIDTEAFHKAIEEYKIQLSNLNTIKTNISSNLKVLKESGWNSRAGEACMKKFDDKWAKEIDKYINLVDFLDEVLQGAQPEFENLIDEANKLQVID